MFDPVDIVSSALKSWKVEILCFSSDTICLIQAIGAL